MQYVPESTTMRGLANCIDVVIYYNSSPDQRANGPRKEPYRFAPGPISSHNADPMPKLCARLRTLPSPQRYTLTFCTTQGGNIATDTCGHGSHPIYSSVYNFGGINVTTTAPVYQWFGPSNNQGNTQFEGHTMGPDMENGRLFHRFDDHISVAELLPNTPSSTPVQR